MKKLSYLIVLVLILGLVLAGCSLLSNIGQAPATEQNGISYLTKDVPLPDDLVGLWHFDEGIGTTAYDSSLYGNDGTITEATYAGSANAMFSDALSFDGSNDYVNVLENTGLDISYVTIEMWIKPAMDPTSNVAKHFIDKRTAGTWVGEYTAFIRGNGAIQVQLRTTGTNAIFNGVSGLIPMNEWSHIAFTWDGSMLTVYRNGTVLGTASGLGAILSNSESIKIGVRSDLLSASFFDGIIDEVRIWNRALTDTEIAYNYSLGDVGIDIKPGSDPNSINLGSNGVVPVAILGSADFDAAEVNPLTVTLSGAAAKLKGNSGNAGSLEDVNDDGYLDRVVQVYTEQLVLTSDTVAVLNAYTYAGLALTGSDLVRIVQEK